MIRAPYTPKRLFLNAFPCIISVLMAGPLVACATSTPPEPRVAVRENPLPTMAKCKASATRPDYADTDAALKAATDDRFVQLLQAGRTKRIQYIGELEAALTGCGGHIE